MNIAIVQGMAFGTGSAIGRRAVDSMMGGGGGQAAAPVPVARHETHVSMDNGACAVDQRAFLQCMQESKGNASACDIYFTALQKCQTGRM